MAWLIYGANGYTGRLIAQQAAARGMKPMLAGRSADPIRSLAKELKLEARVFSLDDASALRKGLEDVELVLHCAGPFSATSRPMLEACIESGTHYLDITGEVDVFSYAWRQDARARRADVVVCPGVGFDVVPTDCLAAGLVGSLPAATDLILAFEAGGGLSPGTARTAIEGLARGGCIRRDGELVRVPIAWKTREIPFAHGLRKAVTIGWGDVFTAFVSTGVPNVEVYVSVSPEALRRLSWIRRLRPLVALPPVQNWLKNRVRRSVSGPDAERRSETGTEVWGQARSADGRSISGTLSGPNGYDLTVAASLGIVEHVLAHDVEGGYYTPSLLVGPDYARSLAGVTAEIGPLS